MEKESLLYSSTLQLTETAQEINNKIKNQNIAIETIQTESVKNQTKFNANLNFFAVAIDKLENDKRNILIIVLLMLIFLLLYYFKNM